MTTRVFHRGSLGDSVLLWPMLRALAARGPVALVTDRSKALLAARELGIEGIDAEQRDLNALWVHDAPIRPVDGVQRVIAVGFDPSGAGATWLRNAARLFPGAAVDTVPGRVTRPEALRLADREGGPALPPLRSNPRGQVVVHVGAGSDAKRWPMERWRELAAAVPGAVALAGEVEAERFTAHDRRVFESIGGRYLTDLLELADLIRSARAYVGADTGPTHLAAALGVPTIALFGPTDPELWGPIGPAVHVITAPGGAMPALDPGAVLHALGAPPMCG